MIERYFTDGGKHRNKDGKWCLWEDVEKLQAENARHNQQGGILMKCGHPVQCAYSQAKIDGGPKCSMCNLQAENERLKKALKPFAEFSTLVDITRNETTITLQDFIEAKRALNRKEGVI